MSVESTADASAGERPRWRDIERWLEQAGFRPSRRLGQNFLRDDNALAAIVRVAGVLPGDFVLEVGPGCGVLTRHLAAAGARVLAVEIDPRLVPIAQQVCAGPEASQVRWLVADALAGKHALDPAVERELPADGEFAVVANLPYAISSPLIAILAKRAAPPRSMTVMVQHEVARRLAAQPGSEDWGPLSLVAQLAYRITIDRVLPPQLFWPRPKVDSAVVRLGRRDDRPTAEAWTVLELWIERLFRERRKALSGLLRRALGDAMRAERVLAELGIEGSSRPEVLRPDQWLALARIGPSDA